MERYILAIDQSTQGTKALLFDNKGKIVRRGDLAHEQKVNDIGWVSHDPDEIYNNLLAVVHHVVVESGINKDLIAAVGISNQRETSIAFDRAGRAVTDAIVWQCARATEICEHKHLCDYENEIYEKTGLKLSPYFPAAKFSWLMENVPETKALAAKRELCLGTMDTYLIYRLTKGSFFATDYSNASRTQLFNLHTLRWDETLCKHFDIPLEALPEVKDSDGFFGMTDFEGFLKHPIPIKAVLGDSHAALFGHGCLEKGMVKATYGTGSSIMMNTGNEFHLSTHGVVTSLAWKIEGEVNYVLEGNINYTGAVITWLKNDLGLINSATETEALALEANPDDHTYLVPAFSGLGAPYWAPKAEAVLCGMSRTTKRPEIVRAALQCIAYQVTDVICAMQEDSGEGIKELAVDGGPTRNRYLMQFQSDLLGIPVNVPEAEEFSCLGVAFLAGINCGVYERDTIFQSIQQSPYMPSLEKEEVDKAYSGWLSAINLSLKRSV